ncbi:Calx-beta domain-containing protein [Cylindrospermopsis raciborskii]|uniref:Calx-beta domain-containing protein n=1 Tax=Cylindrospermopsis raciborskii TaxID=77022 RepID=UPI003DA2AE13
MTPLINQALSLVYTQLSYFSESSNYYQVLSTAFGNNYDRDIAEKLKLHWQQVNFTQIPQIEILDGGILGSAYGAYARETNKIYLSRNFVTNNTAEVIGRVILEELGHFVDGQLNVEDSEGDEGAIFAELVVGNSLDDQALRKLRTESDFGIITLNGQQVHVEQSSSLSLPGVRFSSVAWADYDGDGNQDFLLTGYSSSGPIAKLYRNTGNGFEEDTNVSLPGVYYSSVAWADYDGDGKQDFLLTGFSSDFPPIAKLYRNTGNGFEDKTPKDLPGVSDSSVAWADYDGDGKQDFLLTGFSSDFTPIAKLYRNTVNGFQEDTTVPLPGVAGSSVAWADYNGDGKQDFLLTGYSSDFTPIAKLYRNTGNGFEEDTNVSLPGVYYSSVAWADYDGDGKQDFLLTGFSSDFPPIAKLYRNTGNGFEEDTTVSLPGVGGGSAAWVDYDGDGKQDFLLTGYSSDFTPIAKLYKNTGNGFKEDTNVSLPGVGNSSVAWADYDGDKKQDFLLTGWDGSKPITRLVVSKEIFSDLTLAVSPTTVTEDGTSNLVYTFTRTGVISNALTVNYTIGGTATNGTDYNNVGTSVTFAAGSSTATVTVDPTADTTVESDETVILTLASGTGYTIGTTSGVTGTITNDDTQVTLAVSPTSVAEDGTNNLVYTFTRTGVISNALTVNYTIGGTANNGTDYNNVGTSVTFAAGSSTATVTVDPTDDTTVESDETVILTLASGTGYTIGTTSGVTGTGTITNDDTQVTLAVSPTTVTEDGTNNLVYTFTRTGVISNALTVNYTIGGTAANSGDYGSIGTSVTFAAGSSTATVTVDPTGDTTVESDETVILTLASGTGYTIGTTSGVTGTITNDDTQVTLAVSPTTVTEDGTNNLVYTFTRTGVISNDLTVNYTIGGTANNSVDYGSIGTSVTFAAGSSTATVTVDPTADTTVESDETVILTLASGTGYTIGTTSGVTGTITNDDTQVTLAVSPTTVTEDGTNNLVYTFTRTGVISNALTVNYTIGGTANNSGDYGSIGTSVTFAAGSSTATVTVDPTADTTVESDETVILTLASGTGYTIGTTSGVTGTITNDDTQVTLAVSPTTVTEDGTSNLVYTFTRTGVISNALTVNYTIGGTANNSGDYGSIGTSVTFAAGSSTATVTVDPTADTTVESDETVILTLASGTGYTIGTTSGVTGTITNDDTQVTLAVSPTTVTEDGTSNLVYTFTRTGVISNAITVNYTIGGTANNSGDYGSIGTSVTFAAGSSTATVTVDPTADTTVESDETVILTLASGTGYTIGTTSGVTGTITNDDTQVTLAVSPTTVTEDGTSNLVYTFTRTGVISNALTVNYTIGGTANNSGDYGSIGTSVTFAAGSSTATVTVDPTADTTVESDETVILTLASGTGYTIGTTSGVTGTITNDDTQVTLAVSPTTVTEDGTSNLVYTFTRTGVISNAITVNYTIGGTATNGTDYNNVGTSVTFAAGSSTATVTVDPTADTTVESDETVILTLASGTGYTIGTTSGVTGTITNDDTQVTLAVSPTSVAEDGTNNLVYTFTRTGVISNALTVNYTIGGTATNGTDYNNVGTSVTFDAGSSTATVRVNPTDDTTAEADETVIFTLASGTGYTIETTSEVKGTIVDDDTAGTYYSSVLWFDYDNDFSKEEFLLTGYTLNIGSISQVHKYNNQQSYKAEPFGEKGLFAGSVALSSDRNYLLLTGATKFDKGKGSASQPTSKLYKNTGNGFEEDKNISLPGVYYSSVAWADYDGDGNQDFLLTGLSSSDVPTAKLYKNTGSGFEEDENISLPGVYYSSVAWSNDGKYLLLTGESVSGPISKVYENKLVGNTRRLVAVDISNFPNVKNGSVAWGDQYFLITGLSSNNSPISKVYKNTGNGFEEDENISLPGVRDSSVAWADYDKDGDQDFVLTGFGETGPISKLYKNTSGKFEDDAILSIPGVYYSSVNWNKNGDLVLTGLSSLGPITKVYKNIYDIYDSNTKGFTETIPEPKNSQPDVTLYLSQRTVKEGQDLTFTFTRRGDITQELKVTYRIGGTAGKDDYQIGDQSNQSNQSSSITIPANQKRNEIKIKTQSDVLVEGLETLELSLETSNDYTVGTTNPVQGFIQDTNVSNNPPTLDPKAITGEKLKTYPEQLTQGADLSKLSYQFLDYNSPTVRAKLDSALNLTNSVFTNFLGLYEVDDPNTGAVNGFFPGDPGYAEAALSRRVQNFYVKAGGSATNITTNGVFAQNPTPEGNPSTINDVRYLAPFLIANIGSKDITAEIGEIIKRSNSSAEYQDKSVAYFSFGAANPGGMSQIKHFGNGIFGFEDLPLNVSDRDFNDTVFSFG